MRTMADCIHSGVKTAAFGGALGFAVLFFASGIPRVKSDVLQVRAMPPDCFDETNMEKGLPFIGGYFIKEVHPADNVSTYRAAWAGNKKLTCTALLNTFALTEGCLEAMYQSDCMYKRLQ
jgi:Ubiquinol-cytochrome-c reductase complex subunit (QCR10)